MLEGGLPAWKAAGGPLDTSAARDEDLQRSKSAARSVAGPTKYKAKLKKDKVRCCLAVGMGLGLECASPAAHDVVAEHRGNTE